MTFVDGYVPDYYKGNQKVKKLLIAQIKGENTNQDILDYLQGKYLYSGAPLDPMKMHIAETLAAKTNYIKYLIDDIKHFEITKNEDRDINKWKEYHSSKKALRREAIELLDFESLYNIEVGGERRLYYLRVVFKNKPYYKIGITKNTVADRYKAYDNFIILYDKIITKAETIETQIKKEFKADIFPIALLGTMGTEFFDRDVLGLDFEYKSN